MTTIIKIIIATLLSSTLFSCNFNLGVRGNGNVQIEERSINKPFSSIEATGGLNIYLAQEDEERITVEADENLQELIVVEVSKNVLKIHTKESIGHAASKKVMVSFKDISQIIATSGSNVFSTNTLTTEHLAITSTSGSYINLDVNTASLDCKSTSGSNLHLSGKTNKLIAIATSGSDVKASELMAESSQVTATSGADITVNTSKKLSAKATSGGDIKYYGNPKKVEKTESDSGGSIRKQ